MSDEVVTAAPAAPSTPARTVDLRLPGWASAVFGTIVLLLVLGILGRPSVFPDTASYMLSGKDFWRTVATPLHLAPPAKPVSAAVGPRGGAEIDHVDESLTVLGARRPWYGVFAWPIERVGTLWLLTAVQSGMAAWLIWLSWRTLAPGAAPWTAYAVQGVTGALSTLPFIAGFAMPDIFVSCMVIAVTLLLVARDRLHRNECTGLAVIVCYSTIVHGANLLLAGAMVVLAGMMAFRAKASRGALLAPICMVIVALGIGMAANMLFDLKVSLIYGRPVGRPPFLAARLIADGPGRSYLRQACDHAAPYLLCRHKAEPLDDSQSMLWSLDPANGVFNTSSPADRRILQREEGRFVIGTFLHAPAGVVATATANWIEQLGMVYTDAPLIDQRMYFGHPENYPAELPHTPELYIPALIPENYRSSSLPTTIKRVGACTGTEPSCQPRLTMAAAASLQIAEFLAACVALAVIAVQMVRRPSGDGLWLRALALVAFAVALNALLCGVLSGPFPRYQSAVAWLAVMMAAIGGCNLLANAARRLGC
jgi:hypothetical protein